MKYTSAKELRPNLGEIVRDIADNNETYTRLQKIKLVS